MFPLANWNMTEKDCLKYCYDKGFDWLEDFYNEVMSSKAILRYEIKKREEELLSKEEK